MTATDFRPKSDFLRVILERGYMHQCSDLAGLDEKAAKGEATGYIGFDCTAPSLHVGNAGADHDAALAAADREQARSR
jgi:tyrosyl-tRNA synthetase